MPEESKIVRECVNHNYDEGPPKYIQTNHKLKNTKKWTVWVEGSPRDPTSVACVVGLQEKHAQILNLGKYQYSEGARQKFRLLSQKMPERK